MTDDGMFASARFEAGGGGRGRRCVRRPPGGRGKLSAVEAGFWRERWEEGTTAWDQSVVHPALAARWPTLGLAPGSTVLVPLCGASIDMAWLAEQGHRVMGTELSEIGVRQFFERVGLSPRQRSRGAFTVFEDGPFELWCGDHFALTPDDVHDVVAVYDRASLVALPRDMRRRYAAHLSDLVPPGAVTFLLTFVYDQTEMDGPPFSVDDAEVQQLYGERFDVELVDDDDITERNPVIVARGVSVLREQLHLLRRHA
jgi:thiopurine S-methyltransferase